MPAIITEELLTSARDFSTVDTILANGGTPSFARKDTLGRKYAKMAVRRLRGEE